jgi:hypothetical protein
MDRNGETTFSRMILGGVILKRMMLCRRTVNRMIFNTMDFNK